MSNCESIPRDYDAERAVLSCLLRDPERLIPEAAAALSEDAFYSTANKSIFRTLVHMHGQGEVDAILLNAELHRLDELEKVGGARYVVDLINDVPTPAMFPGYVAILRELHGTRQLIRETESLLKDCYARAYPVTELGGRVAEIGLRASESASGASESQTWAQVAHNALDAIQARFEGREEAPGFEWPLEPMNRLNNGIRAGTVTVVAARPGCGKTAFVVQCLEHLAAKTIPCGFFSTEMTATDVLLRSLSGHSGIDSRALDRGFLRRDDLPKLARASSLAGSLPIWIDDRPGLTVQEIETTIQRWVKDHGVKVVAIDYLQILKPPAEAWSKEDAVARISAGMIRIAKRLNVAVLLLSQLSRGNDDAPPKLDRLRDSGSIEQDASGVVFIHPDPDRDDDASEIDVEFIFAKWRTGGAVGAVPAVFKKPITRFFPISQ